MIRVLTLLQPFLLQYLHSESIIDHSPRTPIYNPSSSLTITSPIPPSQPLTPTQRLIHHNTRKYQNKEPKYNRSQPDNPDAESVLRS